MDDMHANPEGAWQKMGSPAYPTPEQISTLDAASQLVEEVVVRAAASNQQRFRSTVDILLSWCISKNVARTNTSFVLPVCFSVQDIKQISATESLITVQLAEDSAMFIVV